VEVLVEGELGFAGFVRARTPALLRTAYLLTGNASAAEELVQDTLVRLYPKWDKVEAADVPIAYVRRALTNVFLNERRRASSRDILMDLVPDRPAAGDTSTRYEDRDEIWRLLDTLGERQRAALVLRFFHDLPDEEIAAALGCRVGTVRSLISRGLAALREQYRAEGASAAPGGMS
jgi:RNA polymerase sigma-70 factor (sigma-E family)